MKQLNKEQMHGVVGTAIVHIILLLILLGLLLFMIIMVLLRML